MYMNSLLYEKPSDKYLYYINFTKTIPDSCTDDQKGIKMVLRCTSLYVMFHILQLFQNNTSMYVLNGKSLVNLMKLCFMAHYMRP